MNFSCHAVISVRIFQNLPRQSDSVFLCQGLNQPQIHHSFFTRKRGRHRPDEQLFPGAGLPPRL